MKKHISKTILTTIGLLAAVFTSNSLFAQQTSYPTVFINGIQYIPENAQPPATVTAAPTVLVPAGGVVYAGSGWGAGANAPREHIRKGFFGFGGGVYSLKPEHGENMSHAGGSFGGGFLIAPGKIGQIRISFDLGAYYWQDDGDYEGNKPAQIAIPLMCTVGYEFNLGSPHFRARAGLVLGATGLVYDDVNEAVGTAVTSVGGEIGFSITPRNSFYLDLSYRFISNSKAKFEFETYTMEAKSSANMLYASIGWRF